MLRPSASFSISGFTVFKKSTVFAMRCLSSARLDSVSSCFGGSIPANRAAAPLAVSQAICTWRTNGNMSGNRRDCASADASNFFASACAAALSRIADKLVNPRVSIGTEKSYREIAIEYLLGNASGLRRPVGWLLYQIGHRMNAHHRQHRVGGHRFLILIGDLRVPRHLAPALLSPQTLLRAGEAHLDSIAGLH